MIREKDFSLCNLLNPCGVVQVLEDKWFWCADGDPEKGIIYKEFSPQCNSNKQIAEGFPLTKLFPNAKLVFIERCFVPWDTRSDY